MIEFTPFASSSAANAYRVSCEGFAPLLLDCGLQFTALQKALDYQTSRLAGVLCSHSHADHCLSAIPLMRAGVDCYASLETLEVLKRLAKVPFLHRAHVITPGEKFMIEGWEINPFSVPHDVPCLGFYIFSPDGEDRLLFLTDGGFSPIKPEGLTVLCIEANHSRELMRESAMAGNHAAHNRRASANHMPIENVEKFLDATDQSKLREVFLLHMSDNNSSEADFKARIQRKVGCPVTVCGKGI